MLFSHVEYDHELVVFGQDPATQLQAVIAIHNSNRGPAIGGCRMMPYPDEASALTDVLRLSRGMTYKCAIGDIPFGGGKAIIIGDPAKDKSHELLHSMGKFVDTLGGRYITSFDAGTTLDDVATMGERTAHVGGIKAGAGNASASTAYGVFVCMRRAAKLALGAESLDGLTVAVQGAGNVGGRLAGLVANEGAKVIVADVQSATAEAIANEVGGTACSASDILRVNADILAPCALGAILSEASIDELRCKVVCGGANNQLATSSDADRLLQKGIFYCPDYLANAGGIIDLHYQLNESSNEGLRAHLDGLANTLTECFEHSNDQGISMAVASDAIAEKRFN